MDKPSGAAPARRRVAAWLDALRRRLGNERGASVVELAILAPALIFVTMLIVQFALWEDATHAALAAAQEGARSARENEATQQNWQQTATTVAMTYFHGLDTSVLANVSASNPQPSFNPATNTVTVTVTGTLNGIFPLKITETVTGPVECFRTQASLGGACG